MTKIGSWYLRVWRPEDATSFVKFEAARAAAWEDEGPLFAERGSLPEDGSFVPGLAEAQPEVRGYVRFDGGVHVDFGNGDGYLYADPGELIALGPLFERVRSEAVRLLDVSAIALGYLESRREAVAILAHAAQLLFKHGRIGGWWISGERELSETVAKARRTRGSD